MDAKNKGILTKPQIARLKQLTNGLRVGKVIGARVLVKVVEPYTEMDRVEKEGVLFIPETARDANTPLPTTGVVVAVGDVFDIAEGDMIMFSKFAGSDCYFNEECFRILDEREVLCTLVEAADVGPVVQPLAV